MTPQQPCYLHGLVKVLIAGKLTVEMERLTRVFIGSQGLDPHKWPQLPKKIEVLARRNVMRSLDLDRYRYLFPRCCCDVFLAGL